MPEGDTIYRVARRIEASLVGQQVLGASSRDRLPATDKLSGSLLTSARSRGKHLLVDFDCGYSVHTHFGMTGAWHIYQRGAEWAKPAGRAGLVLTFPRHVAVCYSPKLLTIVRSGTLHHHRQLGRLGPDLLAGYFDMTTALARLRTHDSVPVGEALLNQQLVAGIGNVYKSEVLFLNKTNPFIQVGELSDQQLVSLLEDARRLMQRNLAGTPRKVRFATRGGRVWVYNRSGQPCYTCGDKVTMRRQGDAGRSTYYCGRCQQVAEAGQV